MIGLVIAGEYRVDELIGSGGMAEVYRCVSLSTGRIVALKVLKKEYNDNAEFLRRFQREAQAVLSLSHENIVRSYDVGEDQKYHFIVLEYVGGCTLKSLIRQEGMLPIKKAVDFGCQLLNALENAHQSGIIHRDVKPQNVLINAKGVAKLADFGIARGADASTMTFGGTNVIGSVHYISPEQARGEPVTAESDIYSVGIVLYEMLTGRVPFEGDTTVSIALKHLQSEMRPPIQLRRQIPRALNDVIIKATAKDPQLRYHSAAQMREDLLRAMREPNGTFARLHPEPKKKRRVSGVLKIGLLCILMLSVFAVTLLTVRTLWQRDRASQIALVPKLVGKTVEEAKQTAELRGYSVVVSAWLPDSTEPEGTVLSQSPLAGEAAESGSEIHITVSSGTSLTTVPNLYGASMGDLEGLLAQAGLELGMIEYTPSDTVPVGCVVSQYPKAETELVKGDSVDVWISGTAASGVEMPTLTNYQLANALAALKECGFTRIRIRNETPSTTEAAENSILRQTPSGGMNADVDTMVELAVCDLVPDDCVADVVFNVDIVQRDTPVMVTLLVAPGVEFVLYEKTVDKGEQVPIAFQAVTNYVGDYETILYVSGAEARRRTFTYSYRN